MTQAFQSLPGDEPLRAAWPTPRRDLFSDSDSYIARTRANPAYGHPGWTRDAGRRFHGGLDIAPLHRHAAGSSVRLMFTDLATGVEYPGDEPVWIPEDDIFSLADGIVQEAVADEQASDFGLHLVIRHCWPRSGEYFFTLYGHLAGLCVSAGQPVKAGEKIGRMGATSRIADARAWMAAAPHLHLEVRDAACHRYDPLEFLKRYLPEL